MITTFHTFWCFCDFLCFVLVVAPILCRSNPGKVNEGSEGEWITNHVLTSGKKAFSISLLFLADYRAACCTVATWTKFLIGSWQLCDILLTTFRWLLVQPSNQNARTVGGGVVKLQVGFPTILPSPSLTASCSLIGQLQRKPSESCQKRVKKVVKN